MLAHTARRRIARDHHEGAVTAALPPRDASFMDCAAWARSTRADRRDGECRRIRLAGGNVCSPASTLEHEGHGVGDVVRFRGVDAAGLLERGRIRPVPVMQLCSEQPPGAKPSALASYAPCTARPMNSLAMLRWNHGGRKVSCATSTRGGKIAKSMLPTPGVSLGEVSTRKIDGSGWS